MNIIYLHGFKSSPQSIKGQQLLDYCRVHQELQLHLPDLNQPPLEALAYVSDLIEQLQDVVLIGSSLGGFYATQLVAKYGIPAVLINPAMRPWQLFRDLYGKTQLPYQVHEHWTLTDSQLLQLEKIAVPFVQDADKILVLLQQGDEVLDYREAEGFYRGKHSAMLITEANGNHAMDDFAEKIPMALQFLSNCLK